MIFSRCLPCMGFFQRFLNYNNRVTLFLSLEENNTLFVGA